MTKLKKGKMITNSKGISYYQIGKKYYKNNGFIKLEISKEEFENEVNKTFKEIEKGEI